MSAPTNDNKVSAAGGSSSNNSSAINSSSLRKVSEDPKLRPFLSSLFDSQNYVRTVIREGRSEESFTNIVDGVADINYEIKGYISQHKDDLMSGMQDVATLAQRYASLSSSSQHLHSNIQKLKKDIHDSHHLVSSKTLELEKIHETSILLQQLKQFISAKTQLDHYLKDTKEKDVRNLASVTKTLNDLEKLLENPKLREIRYVFDCAPSIKLYGQNIRLLAQERMLVAVSECNQAAVATSLQVFYNLGCLPEIILMVIDHTVKAAVEVSKSHIDFDLLTSAYTGEPNAAINATIAAGGSVNNVLLKAAAAAAATPAKGGSGISTANNQGSNSSMSRSDIAGATSTGATPSASKSAASSATSASSGPSAAVVSVVQQRLATREVAHGWYTTILEKALQIHVLQRVLVKKEDPTTHEKFVNVLRRTILQQQEQQQQPQQQHGKSGTGSSNTSTAATAAGVSATNMLLGNGQLLDLFWRRFSVALLDVSADKLRKYPNTAIKAYPYFRRAAVEMVHYLLTLDDAATTTSGMSSRSDIVNVLNNGSSMYGGGGGGNKSACVTVGGATVNLDIPSGGIFGCSLWSQEDFLSSVAGGGGGGGSRSNSSSRMSSNFIQNSYNDSNSNNNSGGGIFESVSESKNSTSTGDEPAAVTSSRSSQPAGRDEHSLVNGLKPMKDRYLLHSLQCMTAPILQMFPELDGYTAAVPSKRDLQMYIKAIHAEFVIAIVEGESGLLSAVCKEFIKTVQLMLGKVEGMSLNGADSRKISSLNSFARTGQQEHNAQLFTLLMQLKEALEKIPNLVMKTAKDQASGSVSGGVSTAGVSSSSILQQQQQQRSSQMSRAVQNVSAAAVETSSNGSNIINNKHDNGSATNGSSSSDISNVDNAETAALAALKEQLTASMNEAKAEINSLAQKEFLEPVVALLSGYIKSVLLSMHKEAVISSAVTGGAGAHSTANNNNNNNHNNRAADLLECSSAVNTLVKQFPSMLKSYLYSLPACINVDYAVEEVCMRTLHSFVSIAALLRPATEQMRLRTAKDMAALEMLILSGNYRFQQSTGQCPVQQEFKAFRRLLFVADDIVAGSGGDSANSTSGNKKVGKNDNTAYSAMVPPTFVQLRNLPYIGHLRPSSVMGYLLTCGPSQLPSPAELPNSSLQAYVEILTDTSEVAAMLSKQQKMSPNQRDTKDENLSISTTVRCLYAPRPNASSAAAGVAAGGAAGMAGIVLSGWRKISNERKSWEAVQQSLDLLFRRISVTEGAAQKASMRIWYEHVMDIGSQYHGGGGLVGGK